MNSNELLRKAIFTVGDGAGSGDLGGPAGEGGFENRGQSPLSIEQATTFIELMTAGQSILNDVRRVSSKAAKWNESIIDFGGRITRPGVESNRLDYSQRAKPLTGLVEIDTDLQRAEVDVSDESYEDNVAGESLDGSITRLIADQVGYDVEELFVNGDETSADTYLAQQDGWLVRCRANGNVIDASTATFDSGRDYQAVFKALLKSLPQRYLRNIRAGGRYYVPLRLEIEWRDVLAGRGTPLGDLMLTQEGDLRYQGIRIIGSAQFEPAVNTNATILLTHSQNLLAGFHRQIRFETFRDPREGYRAYVVSARVGSNVSIPEATAIADGVDISD